jgi:hypothetical protein
MVAFGGARIKMCGKATLAPGCRQVNDEQRGIALQRFGSLAAVRASMEFGEWRRAFEVTNLGRSRAADRQAAA